MTAIFTGVILFDLNSAAGNLARISLRFFGPNSYASSMNAGLDSYFDRTIDFSDTTGSVKLLVPVNHAIESMDLEHGHRLTETENQLAEFQRGCN